MNNENWFVYIIQSERDGSLYTGITNNLSRRLNLHNSGKGARRTRGRGPWVFSWTGMVESKSKALITENRIKSMSRQKKIALIRSGDVHSLLRNIMNARS